MTQGVSGRMLAVTWTPVARRYWLALWAARTFGPCPVSGRTLDVGGLDRLVGRDRAEVGRDPALVTGRDPAPVAGREPADVSGLDPADVLGRELAAVAGRDPPLGFVFVDIDGVTGRLRGAGTTVRTF